MGGALRRADLDPVCHIPGSVGATECATLLRLGRCSMDDSVAAHVSTRREWGKTADRDIRRYKPPPPNGIRPFPILAFFRLTWAPGIAIVTRMKAISSIVSNVLLVGGLARGLVVSLARPVRVTVRRSAKD